MIPSTLEYLIESPSRYPLAVSRRATLDIFKTKEVLRGHMCIVGDVPCSLLQAGTPEEMIDFTKEYDVYQ